MAAASVYLATNLVPAGDLRLSSRPGCQLKQSRQSLVHLSSRNLSLHQVHVRRSKFTNCKVQSTVRAGYSNEGRGSGSSSIFVGGFILGGIIMGTLGCVYAPQISRALSGTDKKDLMKKLPKFIYDEEKALERTRKVLAEKIAQLNSAIDDVSLQLKTDDVPNGAAVTTDEVEAAI